MPRLINRRHHRRDAGVGGNGVFVIDGNDNGGAFGEITGMTRRRFGLAEQSRNRSKRAPCQPERRRENQSRTDEIHHVDPVCGTKFKEQRKPTVGR